MRAVPWRVPFRFTGIDHVQLAAPPGCEDAARAFYVGLLGWEEIPKPEPLRSRGGVGFHCGEHQLHVGVQADFLPATKAHPAFEVVGLEQLRAHLVDHRVAVSGDDARGHRGIERFYAQDPFGNRIEFMERLHGAET